MPEVITTSVLCVGTDPVLHVDGLLQFPDVIELSITMGDAGTDGDEPRAKRKPVNKNNIRVTGKNRVFKNEEQFLVIIYTSKINVGNLYQYL